MELIQYLRTKAKQASKKIVLPESSDERILRGAAFCQQAGIAQIILLGNENTILKKYQALKLNPTAIQIVNHLATKKHKEYSKIMLEIRKHKGMTEKQAFKFLTNPLYFGVMMVKNKDADGLVAGTINTTANLLIPALNYIKTAPDYNLVSSLFLTQLKSSTKKNNVLGLADCAVNPEPTAEQLAEIAICSANTFRQLTSLEPKVALLSFSTKGSAKHPLASKVIKATQIAVAKKPNLILDGELQLDAALVPKVANSKAKNSPVKGEANILIFPDLNSGNIGYKLIQRIGKATIIGPILQGIAAPINDLSRGCEVEEVINIIAVTAIQAQLS